MPVALQNAIVTTTVLLYLFSVSATGFAVLTLSMSSSSAGNSSPRTRSLKKKSVADNMALKIGLNVVPKKKSGSTNNVGNDAQQTKTNKVRAVKVPTITWTQNVKNFFWRDNEQSIEKANLRNTSRTITGVPARQRGERQVQVQVVANKEEFPLYLLRNVLSPKSLARALSIVMDEDTALSEAEEMEQHERVSGGKVRTLRRSIVSRLKCTTDESSKSLPNHVELLNMIVSGLPVELVEGMPLSVSTKDNGNTSIHKSSNSEHVPTTTTHTHSHQYEDGSIVYYRTTGNDFYDTHHDSYAPGDPPRKRQRAYTILLYLRAPPGLPLMGGTEFPRLTPLRQGKTSDSTKGKTDTTTSTRKQSEERLVVKPRPGDALVWPNFDEDGNPHMHSVHRALSIAPSTPPTTISKGKLQADEIARKDKDDDLMGKIVVNLWFEG